MNGIAMDANIGINMKGIARDTDNGINMKGIATMKLT